jgi:hypothetical protein
MSLFGPRATDTSLHGARARPIGTNQPFRGAERIKAARASAWGAEKPKLLILPSDFQPKGHSVEKRAMTNATFTPAQQEAARQGRKERQTEKAARATAMVDALLAGADGPIPAYAQAHAAKARKGRTASMMALKCLDCCCWDKGEVAACPVTSCPLHPLRPYKR